MSPQRPQKVASVQRLSFTSDPRRVELERLARQILLAKRYRAPITVALALIDAILKAGWQPPTVLAANPAQPAETVSVLEQTPSEPAGNSRDIVDRLVAALTREGIHRNSWTAIAQGIVADTGLLDALAGYRLRQQALGLVAGEVRRTTEPHHRMPPTPQSLPPGCIVGYIAELDDDSEGPQFMWFSEDVLGTEAAGREQLADANEWRPGWHLYRLTDITEEPTDGQ